jgi:hypothetical protein
LHKRVRAALCNRFAVEKEVMVRVPGVREYATPGCAVQPLRGKDRAASRGYFVAYP